MINACLLCKSCTHILCTLQLDHFPANLTIPSLPSFNKLDQKRLESRRQSLNTYLQMVTSNKFLRTYPKALGHLVLFLTEGQYTRTKTELTRMVRYLKSVLIFALLYVQSLCQSVLILYVRCSNTGQNRLLPFSSLSLSMLHTDRNECKPTCACV